MEAEFQRLPLDEAGRLVGHRAPPLAVCFQMIAIEFIRSWVQAQRTVRSQ